MESICDDIIRLMMVPFVTLKSCAMVSSAGEIIALVIGLSRV